MRIEVYIDDEAVPYKVLHPPQSFHLDTQTLNDGTHCLAFKAIDDDGTTNVHRMRFTVRNGPGIAVHGIREDDIVAGKVSVLANAYSGRAHQSFEPIRVETPAPIPTWAWLLLLGVFAWGMWYLGIETTARRAQAANVMRVQREDSVIQSATADWATLGAQVYGNNCSSCHQVSGDGLPGLFPSLRGNAVVRATDPSEQIRTILAGLTGKTIDDVQYSAPMPSFAEVLADKEIAAVINHTRTSWENAAPLVNVDDIRMIRKELE